MCGSDISFGSYLQLRIDLLSFHINDDVVKIVLCIIYIRVFANGPGDLRSIPGRVIPKDFKNGTWYLLV